MVTSRAKQPKNLTNNIYKPLKKYLIGEKINGEKWIILDVSN